MKITSKVKKESLSWLCTAFIFLIGFTMMVPFLWMISASLKNQMEVTKIPIEWIPKVFRFENYKIVWNIGDIAPRDYHFALSYWNSIKVTLINMTGCVITSGLAGYAFAKIKFRGANIVFLLYLSTMMIPQQVIIIPKFIIFDWMGILGTHLPLILPGIVTPTGTFMMRQYFLSVPDSLREAGKIDGASEFYIWARIMMPLAKPVIGAITVLTFMWNWNNYLEPLVYLSDWRTYTIPVNLTSFVGENVTQYNLIMAASVSAILPMLIVFIIGQKFFVKGLTTGSVKG